MRINLIIAGKTPRNKPAIKYLFNKPLYSLQKHKAQRKIEYKI